MSKSGWQSIQRLRFDLGQRAPAGVLQRPIDESRVASSSKPDAGAPSRFARPQITSWLERHSPGGSTSFGPSRMYWLAAALVDVVVLDEHGGGQYDVRYLGCVGHELLVHAHEQVVAREAAASPASCSGATVTGLVF